MTGFGQATGFYENKEITVDIKALNGKVTDVRIKLPNLYKEKEIELRKIILNGGSRGKMDVSININGGHMDDDHALNSDLFTKYFHELNSLRSKLDIPDGDIVQTILRIPNVIGPVNDKMAEAEWEVLKDVVNQAIEKINAFRVKEGESQYDDLKGSVVSIQRLLSEVGAHEDERKTLFTKKIKKNLEEFMQKENVDKNRFEQELLFYLEKLDINEEKVRLGQHCDYFLSEMDADAVVKGKKLGFIAQEIGREINTMGAKAQYAPLQKVVVQMKEQLEKIREQALNVL